MDGGPKEDYIAMINVTSHFILRESLRNKCDTTLVSGPSIIPNGREIRTWAFILANTSSICMN